MPAHRVKRRVDLLRCSRFAGIMALMLGLFGTESEVFGQAQLADELVILGKGAREQERGRDELHYTNSPGATGNRLSFAPGAGQPALTERSPGDVGRSQRRDVLSAASGVSPPNRYSQQPEALPGPNRLAPNQLSTSGPLEIPEAGDEGPTDGLTIEAAIDMLVSRNLDLRTKFQEIPKSEADILTAGLRGNPLVFGSIDDVPYGQYTQQRPGETGYGITIIQPWDINHKRTYRVIAARRARDVLQAQYQNAVRLEIDNLYTAYVDVLAARESLRYVQASIAGLDELKSIVERQVDGKHASKLELDRVIIQRSSAQLGLEEATATLSKARQSLANQLNLPLADDSILDVRGSLRTQTNQIPSADELIAIAFSSRPDLTSYRLGTLRAQSEVDLAQKEAYPDVFVLYTPWGLQDNRPTGGQNANSWGISAMASVPIFNRNQGNIRRAQLNSDQTRNEWVSLTRQAELEVRQAAKDYEVAFAAVKRLESDMIPQVRGVRDATFRLMKAGEVDSVAYLSAQREYVDVVRQYRDALIRLRRSGLKINTVIAMRLVP